MNKYNVWGSSYFCVAEGTDKDYGKEREGGIIISTTREEGSFVVFFG
jgi:hypothetical protein